MTTPGFQGITAATDLIDILDTVEVPIVVAQGDCTIVCFNKAAADMLGLSAADVGRTCRDILVLAGLPRLEQQCRQVIADGLERRADFRDRDKWFVVRISPYTNGDRQVIGTVLTFTNVTAFRASIDRAIYEREFTKAILNTVADPLVVLSADQRIQSGIAPSTRRSVSLPLRRKGSHSPSSGTAPLNSPRWGRSSKRCSPALARFKQLRWFTSFRDRGNGR